MSIYRIVRRNAAGPWTPASLTDLHSWYDADASSTTFDATSGGSAVANNGGVARWEDRSGNGYHVTQSTSGSRPTYKTSTLNSRPVLEFDGGDWLGAATASDWTFLHNSNGSTIVAAWKPGTTSSPTEVSYSLLSTGAYNFDSRGMGIWWLVRNETWFWSTAFSQQLNTIVRSDGTQTSVFSGPSVAATMTANQYGITAFRLEPSSSSDRERQRVNGSTDVKPNEEGAAPSSSSPTHALQIGSSNSGENSTINGTSKSHGLVGGVAEIVICDAILSTANVERVEGYLAHKWGLASSLPAGHPYKDAAPTA